MPQRHIRGSNNKTDMKSILGPETAGATLGTSSVEKLPRLAAFLDLRAYTRFSQ